MGELLEFTFSQNGPMALVESFFGNVTYPSSCSKPVCVSFFC